MAASDLSENKIATYEEKIACYSRLIKDIRPTGIKEFVLEVPNVVWDDICGNDLLKKEIEQVICLFESNGGRQAHYACIKNTK